MSNSKEAEQNLTPEKIRQAQKAVGEMLWLVTRSRPDVMFAVAKMGADVTRNPTKVLEIYHQCLGYLATTSKEGLKFTKTTKDTQVVEACGCLIRARGRRKPWVSGGEVRPEPIVLALGPPKLRDDEHCRVRDGRSGGEHGSWRINSSDGG